MVQLLSWRRNGLKITSIKSSSNRNWKTVRSLIQKNSRATYDDLEAETLLPRGTIEAIIPENLKKRKIASCWVPHELTPMEEGRVRICKEILRNKVVHGGWVKLLLVMKHGFLFDRLVIRRRMLVGLIKVKVRVLSLGKVDMNQKDYFLSFSGRMAELRCML